MEGIADVYAFPVTAVHLSNEITVKIFIPLNRILHETKACSQRFSSPSNTMS